MELSETNIKKIVDAEPVGDFEPYNKGSRKSAEKYARKIINKLKEIKLLEVDPELDDYGSGYASYYDVFVTKKDKSQYQDKENYIEIIGITIYLSKLAPISVYGPGQKTRSETGGSYGYLSSEVVCSLPPGDWTKEMDEIQNLLNIYRIAVLSREEVSKKLWFKIDIPTIFGKEDVFDALFYWED